MIEQGLTIFLNFHPAVWRQFIFPSIKTRMPTSLNDPLSKYRVGLFFVWVGVEISIFVEPKDKP